MENEIRYVLVGENGQVYPLPSKGPFLIGRNTKVYSQNDIDLFPDEEVSRQHAAVMVYEKDNDGVIARIVKVVDRNSGNGTYLNGRKLSPFEEPQMKVGDTLTFATDVRHKLRLALEDEVVR